MSDRKESPLAALWRNEMTGMTKSAVRHMFVHDERLAIEVAAEGIRRGADPEALRAELESLHLVPRKSAKERRLDELLEYRIISADQHRELLAALRTEQAPRDDADD